MAMTAASFEAFAQRVPEHIRATCMCPWSDLEEVREVMEDPEALMADLAFYWIGPSGRELTSDTAEGVVAVCSREGATKAGVILCIGLVDLATLQEAAVLVRNFLIRTMPVPVVRMTLWHRDLEGRFKLDKSIEEQIKEAPVGFRWFQLTNTTSGQRGQVMQSRRHVPPDGADPPMPEPGGTAPV